MKNLALFLCVLTLSLSSCGNDDDGNNSSQDSLIGSWELFQTFINGDEVTLDICELMQTIIVKSDGTFTVESFEDNGSSCVSDGISNGIWENLGNNSYKITSDIGTEDEDAFTATFTFENNTFSIELVEGSDTLKQVFKRK